MPNNTYNFYYDAITHDLGSVTNEKLWFLFTEKFYTSTYHLYVVTVANPLSSYVHM